MSFDQNMIIDATTGSIARFVNHSCSPNCRMIKWIVSGQPRMALFAGDRPITTGEELTYDYNFDPFSAKNVQKCLCGSANCRGVLGPKPKEVKAPKPKEEKKPAKVSSGKNSSAKSSAAKSSAAKGSSAKTSSTKSSSTKTGKRKLKDAFEFVGDDEEDTKTVKKRNVIKAATGLKRTLSSASLKVAKGAAKGAAKGKGAVATIKKSVSTVSVAAKKKKTALAASSKVSKTKVKVKTASTSKRAGTGGTTTVVKAYAKKSTITTATSSSQKIVVPSRSPSLTIVAAGVPAPASASASSESAKRQTPKAAAKVAAAVATSPVKTSSRKVTPSRKALEAGMLDKKSPALSVKSVKKGSEGLEVAVKSTTTTTATKIKVVSK